MEHLVDPDGQDLGRDGRRRRLRGRAAPWTLQPALPRQARRSAARRDPRPRARFLTVAPRSLRSLVPGRAKGQLRELVGTTELLSRIDALEANVERLETQLH